MSASSSYTAAVAANDEIDMLVEHSIDIDASLANPIPSTSSFPLLTVVHELEDARRPRLRELAREHNLHDFSDLTVVELQRLILCHLSSGRCRCLFRADDELESTIDVAEQDAMDDVADDSAGLDVQIQLLRSWQPRMRKRSLRRLLQMYAVDFELSDSVSKLRRLLRKYIKFLDKGKQTASQRQQARAAASSRQRADARERKTHDRDRRHAEIRARWPQLVNPSLKEKLVRLFRAQTSKDSLASFTCASCAEATLCKDRRDMHVCDVNLELLKWDAMTMHIRGQRLPPFPYASGPLHEVLVHPAGVLTSDDGTLTFMLCPTCKCALSKDKVPPLAIANHLVLGAIPDELRDLTVVEESMIALSRATCCIVKMNEENQTSASVNSQRGLKGNVVIYPQRPEVIADILPPTMEDVLHPICVLFVGSKRPDRDWLLNHAKPLAVRQDKVRRALIWLKAHNPLYEDIHISEERLDALPVDGPVPAHIEHVDSAVTADALTSDYDPAMPFITDDFQRGDLGTSSANPIPFQNVVITDVDVHAPANELRAGAMRHLRDKGGGAFMLPHDQQPVNEFCDPSLFPKIYPTLFPYGIGGFEDRTRLSPLSLRRQLKHYFALADRRFQEHFSFLFTAFNIIQRRQFLLHSSLKVKRSSFDAVAADFASISVVAMHRVTSRVAQGDFATADNDEERVVLRLMKEVKLVTAHVPGSSSARLAMRNEIRALMIDKGQPNFYLTINPADVYNPLVKFLAGADIDINNLLPEEVPKYWDQSMLVAKNPAIAAKFFNCYMKAFISALLGYDPKQENTEGGILGVVRAYYGCVEAQGRGTLHCHMLVWVEGGLNPDSLKDRARNDTDFERRLLSFLDDTISNCIPSDIDDPGTSVPSDSHHPCSVRGVPLAISAEQLQKAQARDIHNLVQQCQLHRHAKTCFKYWKGGSDPKVCRFDLDESNYQAVSYVDRETGEICPRCLDGLVNNFNTTIIRAMRCNMDIKFVGSGAAAKAIIYYITDYITKSQLKAHIAWAALDRAVQNLRQPSPDDDDETLHAKRLLQKCAYAMISEQELSAPQVASYLMDYEDHFTDSNFHNLYWTSFQRWLESVDPDVETVPQQNLNINSDNTHQEEDDTHAHDDAHDSDLTVDSDRDGNLIAHATQVADYQLRGPGLSDMSLWDFVAQIERSSRRATSRTAPFVRDDDVDLQPDVQDATDGMLSDDDDQTDEENEEQSGNDDGTHPSIPVADITSILHSDAKFRPQFDMDHRHSNYTSHTLKVLHPQRRRIPVPIGPTLPRRDRAESHPQYCRTMLLLFKPWMQASDLRRTDQTWLQAFDEFNVSCLPRFRTFMDNMQLVHESRDSRDDHFAERATQRRRGAVLPGMGQHGSRRTFVDDDITSGQQNEHDILEHLQNSDQTRSLRTGGSQDDTLRCLQHADNYGIFDGPTGPVPSSNRANTDNNHADYELAHDNALENLWEHTYRTRREQFKMNTARAAPAPAQPAPQTAPPLPALGSLTALPGSAGSMPSLQTVLPVPPPQPTVDIDALAAEFTLNTEQSRAFRIIANHSLRRDDDPLRMYLGGPGGTGKTRVINALREFFARKGESRRLRMCAYMGIAAQNIGGMTLHAALCLAQRTSVGANKSLTRRDLAAMWDGVDFLFVDEVSMVSCNLLLDVHDALADAKGNTAPFGGINIIFAGDFAQLSPPGQRSLYAHIGYAAGNGLYGQDAIHGKLLWLTVTTVVMLTVPMRQTGDRNAAFVALLARLRLGACTSADYKLLQTRLVQNVQPNWEDPSWRDAPFIFSTNAPKDAFNERAAIAFARRMHRPLHWYYAVDKHGSEPLTNPALIQQLHSYHSGTMQQRLGRLPLVIGMPVLMGQNNDVPAGICNGTAGTVKKIRYSIDDQGVRHCTSCVVAVHDSQSEGLPYLARGEAVAFQEHKTLNFKHQYSKKGCKIDRLQVPIVPAFAMTAHKAQGQGFERIVLDLTKAVGTEGPYVMLSRVQSLDGLLILRPFPLSKITSHPSEDRRREVARLELRRLRTLMNHGTLPEAQTARIQLADQRQQADDTIVTDLPSNLSSDAQRARLGQIQEAVERTAVQVPTSNVSRPQRCRKRNPNDMPSTSTTITDGTGTASSSDMPSEPTIITDGTGTANSSNIQQPSPRKRRRIA